jgi:hypothetical protein
MLRGGVEVENHVQRILSAVLGAKMISMNFDIADEEEFEAWLRRVVGQDREYVFLLKPGYEDERQHFYDIYYKNGISPWKALTTEYFEFG